MKRFLSMCAAFLCFAACQQMRSGLDMLPEQNAMSACPEFGQSGVTEAAADGNQIYVRRARGGIVAVPRAMLTSGAAAKTQESFDAFLGYYADVCGGRPPFEDDIPYVIAQRRAAIQKEADEIAVEKQALESVTSELEALATENQAISQELDSIQPVSYLITGDVIRREEDTVLLFGLAVPSHGGLATPGALFQNDGLMVRGIRTEDFLIPTKMYTRGYFRGIARIKNRAGENVQVNVYDHTEPDHDRARVEKLKARKAEIAGKSSELKARVDGLQAREARLREKQEQETRRTGRWTP